MAQDRTDTKTRVTLLLEYYKRQEGKSDNPELHFYKLPELKDTDVSVIKANAIHLINENLVRGGIDDDGNTTFPWISRISQDGIETVISMARESASGIPDIAKSIKNDDPNAMVLDFAVFCSSQKDGIPDRIADIAEDAIP